MTAPKKQAPAAMARSGAQDSKNDTDIIAPLVDAIKARIMAGEIVGALDYPESERPLFWAAIKRVQDDTPRVRSSWRTVSERFIDGLRTREKRFKLCPRQKGVIDLTLAGLIALAATCAALLVGGLPV